MVAAATSIGFHRFGLGPRPGDLRLVGDDIRGALLAELERPDIASLHSPGLLSSAEILAERHRQTQLSHGFVARALRRLYFVPIDRRVFDAEVVCRIDRALTVGTGLVERLVTFWMNHFVVETDANGTVRRTAAAFEREAIRPFVLGRFKDMLLAVTKHPAMLSYLDNVSSIGPNSKVGRESKRGCNENHARELLELHTVGAAAGFSQADVTGLAKVLTGWTYFGSSVSDRLTACYGQFRFDAESHEPGEQRVMGLVYEQEGIDQGEAVLSQLACHEKTAKRIAVKLVRHFVGDRGPPGIVDAIAATFLQSGGDLKACARTLISQEDAWGPPVKIKSPWEFMWSASRALGFQLDVDRASGILNSSGQPFWNPSSPKGFPDEDNSWLAANLIADRLDLAEELASCAESNMDLLELVDAILGPGCSAITREYVAYAQSRSQALALLLMSPEFQRR